METRRSVVLIDDNDVTRAALRFALPVDTVVVVGEASSGQAGLELCLRMKPEIIMLDVIMPDVNGLTLLPQLMETLRASAVIMVTGANDRSTIERAIAAGACGYVVKPFSSGRVEDAILRAVSKISAQRR